MRETYLYNTESSLMQMFYDFCYISLFVMICHLQASLELPMWLSAVVVTPIVEEGMMFRHFSLRRFIATSEFFLYGPLNLFYHMSTVLYFPDVEKYSLWCRILEHAFINSFGVFYLAIYPPPPEGVMVQNPFMWIGAFLRFTHIFKIDWLSIARSTVNHLRTRARKLGRRN
jgi:hypothetical protein